MKESRFKATKQLSTLFIQQMLEAGLKKNPSSVGILFKLLDLDIEDTNWEAAEDKIQKILLYSKDRDNDLLKIVRLFFLVFQFEKAEFYLSQINSSNVNELEWLLVSAETSFRKGRLGKCLNFCGQIHQRFGIQEQTLTWKTRIELRQGYIDKAYQTCTQLLTLQPDHTKGNDLMLQCKWKLEPQDRVLEAFNDLIWVQKFPTEWLKDYNSLKAFNQQLCEELLQRKDWSEEKPHYSLVGGKSIFNLGSDESSSDILTFLHSCFKKLTLQYINKHKKLPYFNKDTDALTMTTNANLLAASHIISAHIHPNGWLSGVYYPMIPSFNHPKEGSLELGILDNKGQFEVLNILQPKEGTLILFPSYYCHQTVPFTQEGIRISIAFDVF